MNVSSLLVRRQSVLSPMQRIHSASSLEGSSSSASYDVTLMPVSTRHRRRASKGPSNRQDADCDDLDDEEQFLSLDDVLEGQFNSPTHLFTHLASRFSR